MAVPYTFASATGSIPLSYLDSNFNTPITIGNTAVTLGSTITTAYNMTLGNVIITSVGSQFPNNYLANANVILGTTTVPLGNTATTLDGLTLSNVTVSTGNVTLTKITVTTANVTTANVGTAVITTANVTTANIGTAVIATANVTTANLTTAAITTGNVTTANLTTAAITTGNVTTANVTTAVITTANVTTANVTTANVTTANIATLAVVNAAFSGYPNMPNTFGFKNRIINGAMVIDQRNAGAEVNPAVDGTYYLDRWRATSDVASKFKIGRNAGAVTPPTGYINYLGCTSLSAYTVGATENFGIQQRIEGLNVADLAWGTASAATVTLSFWVYSSLTGTFGGSLRNSAVNRSYPFTYTISSANTWTQASVTISGDTTGTWLTTNGVGIIVLFGLGSGSTFSGTAGAWAAANYTSATGAVSVVGTNAATFYITGVQLEKGSTATSFDVRPYGTELSLCLRYYQQLAASGDFSSYSVGQCNSTTEAFLFNQFIVPMRAAPSVTPSTIGNFRIYSGASAQTVTSFTNRTGGSVNGNYISTNLDANVASGLTAGSGAILMNATTTTPTLAFSSEL